METDQNLPSLESRTKQKLFFTLKIFFKKAGGGESLWFLFLTDKTLRIQAAEYVSIECFWRTQSDSKPQLWAKGGKCVLKNFNSSVVASFIPALTTVSGKD